VRLADYDKGYYELCNSYCSQRSCAGKRFSNRYSVPVAKLGRPRIEYRSVCSLDAAARVASAIDYFTQFALGNPGG
jgi:hypothetical protein